MTPEQRKTYQEYLADFDPTPQYGGEDYDEPMSEDAWLEEQEDIKLVMERRGSPSTRITLEELSMRPSTGRKGALAALDRLCEENAEGLKRLADS